LGTRLLQGLQVVDMAGEPLAMTGRILADLGADVVKIEPAGGDPLRKVLPVDSRSGLSLRFLAWNAGKSSIEYDPADRRIDQLLGAADVIIETPGFPDALDIPVTLAPKAVWLRATPFGLDGPRSRWRASDLGIMAASGNLYATGYPDRAPLRCSEPASYAHASAEAVFAILTAVASGRAQVVDLSMQEAVLIANMGGAGQYPRTGNKGRRQGAAMGCTREIWPCKDGFVSFGLRGGPARLRNFQILQDQLARTDLLTSAWSERDWRYFNPAALESTELRAIEQPLAAWFARYTMAELYAIAVDTNLMLAPANSAAEILASAQLAARDMFQTVGNTAQFPARFLMARDAENKAENIGALRSAPRLNAGPWPNWHAQSGEAVLAAHTESPDTPAWHGLKLVEFGSGAAGPIASRYFIEHGASVIKVESGKHPDFLRVMAAGSPQGLEGSTLFDALNVGKQSITLNLRHPEGQKIARQLIHWADAVLENFAPKAMASYGLDYDQLRADKPDLLMLSTCLNGHSGPHQDYPGFGGQGAALSGFNFLTGWPDREPIGPFGTITDSLAPRFAASALAAGLLYRRRTSKGLHLDVSQVETGAYSLSPWLLDYAVNGHSGSRTGNRSCRAVPHGVFPSQGDDRWIAIACWNDHEWLHLATILGLDPYRFPDLNSRLAAQDDIERLVSEATRHRPADALAKQLQYAGIEAVPVADFEDLLHRDPQLQQRQHFVCIERPLTGESFYERNGFRLSASPSSFERPSPLLGQHTENILSTELAYDDTAIRALRDSGALD
jgi:crotonobetainyl-CoA:carnitine CoA-transferase CaiB-like acyl-CoA transferase